MTKTLDSPTENAIPNPITASAYKLAAAVNAKTDAMHLETPFASGGVQLLVTDDSAVICLEVAGGGTLACRVAYTPANDFVVLDYEAHGHTASYMLDSIIGHFRVTVTHEAAGESPTLRYTTQFTPKRELAIPNWPKDLLLIDPDGGIGRTLADIHVSQVGTRSGLMHFSLSDPLRASVFYFQNLTALNAYCEDTETKLGDSVGGRGPELGFWLPPTGEKVLHAGREYTIGDAYVVLADPVPTQPAPLAKQFLQLLAQVYMQLPQPPTKYHDYPGLAKASAEQLANHKGCWSFRDGHAYLNAYASDYKTPPESMVQLAVMVPMIEYAGWASTDMPIIAELDEGLEGFYNMDIGTIQRWLLAVEHDLDESEEQKRPMVMDSWYLYHALLNLSRLAGAGDERAGKLFRRSLDYAVKVGRHFNYEWPIFYHMKTLEAIKAEAKPGAGGEKDVGGLYALVMIQAWELTGDRTYLEEAKAAAAQLQNLGFDLFYQANNTALAAVAMMRLWQITHDSHFLDLSYLFLAGLFRNMALWECRYGNGKHFPHFFSLFPLSDAPYTAVYEEGEVLAAFHEYLTMAGDAPVPSAVSVLLPEFIRHAVHRMAYYYPNKLPESMLSDEVKTGEIDRDLLAPLEDVTMGWEPAGAVGQEVYGAGFPFAVVPRHYFAIANGACMLFVDYPVTARETGHGQVSFQVMGSNRMRCRLYVLRIDIAQADRTADIRISAERQGAVMVAHDEDDIPYFELAGGQQVFVAWSKVDQNEEHTLKTNDYGSVKNHTK